MNKRTHISLLSSGLILSSTLLLSACGQKGPLYLPEKKPVSPAATTAPTAPTPPASVEKTQQP
ncbi:LPS translocon maturation chaperone LptM [Undibacterium flavidum]|uniref:LPS translocon maturation chaperone LptM n=1 Tax=Undibacterium flavidum TaxID=2762297 RepID=UPI001C9A3625